MEQSTNSKRSRMETAPYLAGHSGEKRGGLLRSAGTLARWPLIGVVMVLLGGIAFGAIAIQLPGSGPLIQQDIATNNAIHQVALQSSPFIRDVMISGFYIGEQVIVAIGGILGVYFLFTRQWPELGMLVIAWAGEGAIWEILSRAFDRARPVFATPVWHQMTSPGFPSGHAFSALICYGLIAYLLVPNITSRLLKVMVILVALLLIVFVGYSRLFVGDHYLSDVLAGYALGVAWGGFVYTSVELIFKQRILAHVEKR